MIQIVKIENPFELKKKIETVSYTGKTIVDYVSVENKDVYINGLLVIEPKKTYPLDGDQLIIMPHIAGGGLKKVLGFIATIALTVYAGNVGGGLWGGAFAKGTIAASLASGAVLYLGGRLINTVFPQQINNDTWKDNYSDPTYGWNLPTPTTREGEVIGETYGECIPNPQLLEQHVETINDKQYLNLLYCGGCGPVDEISNIRIDNTDISNFPDVQIETRPGTNDQEPISFFTDTPLDQAVGLELELNTPLIRTSDSTKAVALEVTFEFPGGLYHLKDDGSYENATVEFTISYRARNSEEWISATNRKVSYNNTCFEYVTYYNEAEIETWTISRSKGSGRIYNVVGSISGASKDFNIAFSKIYDNGKIKFKVGNTFAEVNEIKITENIFAITAASSSAIRRSFKIDHLSENQYEVKVECVKKPTGSRYATIVQWSILTSYNEGLYSRPNKVLVGMRILATNQLSGGTPNVTWRQKRNTVYVYNPKIDKYEAKAANNPIWAAYDILHGCKKLKNINTGVDEYVVEGTAKENLMKYYDQFLEAANYAEEKIKNQDGELEARFEFDAYYYSAQKRMVAAQKAAAVGHATIITHGKEYGIVVDKPGQICQIFGEGRTSVSSISGSFTSKSERATSIEITYNDQHNDFKNTIFMMRSPLNNEDMSAEDNTAQLTLFGVKRRSQAYREAITALATNERQLQFVELEADVNAMVAEYGDIVGYNHTVSQIGIASGRIIAATQTTIEIDKEIELKADLSYEIYIQYSSNDRIQKRNIVSTTTTTNVLTLATPLDEIPQKYDNYSFGEVNKAVKPFRIVSVGRSNDLLCSLKLAEYDEAMYSIESDYSKYPVIDYTPPQVNIDVDSLILGEKSYVSPNGSINTSLYANWTVNKDQFANKFVVYYSADDGQSYVLHMITYDTKTEIAVLPLRTYYVKVAVISDTGIISRGKVTKIEVKGRTECPTNIPELLYQRDKYDSTKVKLSWAPISDVDLQCYVLCEGNGEIYRGLDINFTYTCKISKLYNFSVVALNTSGYISEIPATISTNIKIEPDSVKNLRLTEHYNNLGQGVYNRSLDLFFESNDDYYRYAEIYLLSNQPAIDKINTSIDRLSGTCDNLSTNAWEFIGVAYEDKTIADVELGKTYTFKIVSVNSMGLKNNFDTAPTISKVVTGYSLVPKAPTGLTITFDNGCHIKWNSVDEVAYYELRTNANIGNDNGLIIKTSENSVSVDLTSRKGDLFLYACNPNGHSQPTSITYYKAKPIAPKNITAKDGFQNITVSVNEFINGVNGISVHFSDGKKTDVYQTSNNSYIISAEAGIYNIQCAYIDLFGEGELSTPIEVEVKPYINPEFIKAESISLDKMNDVIKVAVEKAQTSAQQVDLEVLSQKYDGKFKEATNSINEVSTTVGNNKTTQDGVNKSVSADISNIKQTATGLSSTISSLSTTVNNNKSIQDTWNSGTTSQINQTASQVTSVVTELNKDASKCGYTAIAQTQEAIALRATKANLVSQINVCPEAITIDGKYTHITGDTVIDNNVIVGRMLSANSVTADKIKVDSLSALTATIGTLRTKTSGARVEISDNLIKVYDENNVLRVRMGVW